MWITSMGNHGAARGISERRHSSCSSFLIISMKNALLTHLRPRENRHHVADNIFKCIFLNEIVWISLWISLKFVPKVQINNIPALVQIMAWPGDKPLSEPMMVSLLTHICVTRPQWVMIPDSSLYYLSIKMATRAPPFECLSRQHSDREDTVYRPSIIIMIILVVRFIYGSLESGHSLDPWMDQLGRCLDTIWGM